MRNLTTLGVLAVVFALSAIGAGSASAATFTSNATGTLTGKALNTQTFTVNGGQIKCSTAATSGTIASTAKPNVEIICPKPKIHSARFMPMRMIQTERLPHPLFQLLERIVS